MTEQEFKDAIAEFTAKTADTIEMSDGLEDIGIDSIGIFEFLMKIEDVVGSDDIEITEDAETVQDLYDAVLEAADVAAH